MLPFHQNANQNYILSTLRPQTTHLRYPQHTFVFLFIKQDIQMHHINSRTIVNKSAAKLLDKCKSTTKLKLSKDPSLKEVATILKELTECAKR